MRLALALLLAATAASRPFTEERALLSRRLEALARVLPDGPSPAVALALTREFGEAARLTGFEVTSRPPAEAGAVGYDVVEASGTGRYADMDRFFRQVALSPRLVDVESLSLAAGPSGLVGLTAVLRVPYRPARAPLPAPPRDSDPPPGLPRAQAEAWRRDQALALAKSDAIAELRRSRRNPRLFLAELAAVTRGRPVSVYEARLGEEFRVRGLCLGEGPARDLQSRFEGGFFRVTEFLMTRHGACRRFEVRGTSPVAGPEADLPLPVDDAFDTDEAACRADRDAARGPLVRLHDRAKQGGKGTLTLRLREVDLSDVFQALHLATGQGFLVDGDVTGKASLEVNRGSLEEVLAELRRAGLRIAASGGIRRVSRAERKPTVELPGPSPDADLAERPVSLSLKRVDVRDLLALASEIEPAYAALGPRGGYGRASLWTRDVPLSELRAAILDLAGLRERIEEGRRVLFRPTSPEEPAYPVAATGGEPRLAIGAADLVAAELELVGLYSGGDAYTALAYSPQGRLHAYRAGDKLADASFKAVESADVTLETDAGPLRLALSPLGR